MAHEEEQDARSTQEGAVERPRSAKEQYTADNLPAAFWDEYPENPGNIDLAAINAILEESTPDERAETWKGQGNDALKRGLQLKKKFYLREALTLYSKGLEMGSTAPELLSVLHSNRAQAHLLLENYRSALKDSLEATRLYASNLKGYYRGARAAMKLGEHQQAADICSRGLAVDGGASELQQLLKEAQRKLQVAADARQKEAARALAARVPAKKLAAALLSQQYQIGRPQLSVGDRKPYVDEAGAVHWPLVFVYPETMQMDAVEDAREGDTLADHLDAMFGPDAPLLPWDAEHAYTQRSLELFYLSHATRPLGPEHLTEALHSGWPKDAPQEEGPSRYGSRAAQWVPVQQQATLRDILRRPDYVIPGVPVFFVVAAETPFRDRFLAEEKPLL